ncbi:3-methyladenine DNA glycosylase [Citricoccus zhacaiensis]|uniref:3-methyladenine DNA glycosylase n=1 Tax=Citricoccus zhacaiensis TaxID=489142 RepID=A0ABQ2M241_9MICC|nr:3-methyladenine DNA glycosylase [Citricoccus zhacaiensis]
MRVAGWGLWSAGVLGLRVHGLNGTAGAALGGKSMNPRDHSTRDNGRVLGSLPAPDATLVLEPGVPVDVRLTLGVLQRGHADPTVQSRPDGVWLCYRVPSSGDPVTVLVRPAPSALVPGPVPVLAWGPGAETAVADAHRLLGLDDDWSAFDALLAPRSAGASGAAVLPHAVSQARRANPGLRLPATGRMVDQLLTVVLEQKVTHDQARSGWRWLVRGFGEAAPAPAPPGMLLPPTAHAVRRIPSWAWHAGWVQPAQSRAMLRVAERASALERLAGLPAGVAAQMLTAVPGVGVWTAAETVQRTHGAPDTVAVGDYHLAHQVGEALTGRRTDDAGMLRLLEPWAGHRQRVVRLIGLSGIRFSRFGPRLAPADHRRR